MNEIIKYEDIIKDNYYSYEERLFPSIIDNKEFYECPRCNGQKKVRVKKRKLDGDFQILLLDCELCEGVGALNWIDRVLGLQEKESKNDQKMKDFALIIQHKVTSCLYHLNDKKEFLKLQDMEYLKNMVEKELTNLDQIYDYKISIYIKENNYHSFHFNVLFKTYFCDNAYVINLII